MERSQILETVKRARELLVEVEQREEALAGRLDGELFPKGPPVPMTVEALIIASMERLERSAERMVRADIAHSRVLDKSRPNPGRASLISQEVAEKLAEQAELERIAREHAAEVSEILNGKFFPEGLPADLGTLGLLQGIRGYATNTVQQLENAVCDEGNEDVKALCCELENALGVLNSFEMMVGKQESTER